MQDRDLVEDVHRHGQGQHREGVSARGDDRREHHDEHDGPAPHGRQPAGVRTPTSSSDTKITGNSKVSPNTAMRATIRPR